MPLRVSQIRLPLDGDESQVLPRALRAAGLDEADVASIELVRQSMDRRRRSPEFVYTVDIHLVDEPRKRERSRGKERKNVHWVDAATLEPLTPGDRPLENRPVILGQGPGGLFAALILARSGYRPIIVDRGSKMNRRLGQIREFYRDHVLDPESNYLFGEGGAGTFSDGKLTTRSKDPRARFVLDEFRKNSGMAAVGYYYRPHLGSDRVRAVVAKIRREIESLGGEFQYDCRVTELIVQDGQLKGVKTTRGELPASVLICAPGHSARDFYQELLNQGAELEPKAFQMGFRVEHPQDFIDSCIYGPQASGLSLPPADYRLVAQVKGEGVFSFCMCPGGEIIPAIHDREHFNTNGMSWFGRATGFANSGVVTTISPEEFEDKGPLGGLRFQEHFEKLAANIAGDHYRLPTQRLNDFMDDQLSIDIPPTSCRSGTIPANIGALAPSYVVERVRHALSRFEHQMRGFMHPDAIICGPESRSSAPVRIVRHLETLESTTITGLFPVGEGAGYAGGIISAAIDGWRAAETVINRFACPREE
ncbi:MAG: putative FAD-dependent dehydrogenase [Planctomycetota bacterium]|jgi:uncharacterized FAD-dependent dehydrogenase